jgi:hypothetical protein
MKDIKALKGIFFSYVRTEEKEIVGTVAFRENEDGTINRGIAIVGLGDQPNKDIGRKAAAGRLIAAEREQECNRAMGRIKPACKRFMDCFAAQFSPSEGSLYKFKSGYHVNPTEFEQYVIDARSGV